MTTESAGRFVFDTNTIVSAFLFPTSPPGLALDIALAEEMILLSLETSEEIADVIRRPKFDRYLSRRRREELLGGLCKEATFIRITESISECRDPDDDKFLELAVCGNADAIVSGDQDLLVLNPFRGISIFTPAEFVDSRRGE